MNWKPIWSSLSEVGERLGCPVISQDAVSFLAVERKYDGALAGYALFEGKAYFFDTVEDEPWRRIYGLFNLPEENLPDVIRRICFLQAKYPQHVTSEGKKFCSSYPVQEERVDLPVSFPDYSSSRIRTPEGKNPIPLWIFSRGEGPNSQAIKEGNLFYSQLPVDLASHLRVSLLPEGGFSFCFPGKFGEQAELQIANDGSYFFFLEGPLGTNFNRFAACILKLFNMESSSGPGKDS